MNDLRSFLAFVAEHLPREYLLVTEEVAVDWGISAVVTKLEQRLRTPVVEFRNVRSAAMPVVTNVNASLDRIGKSIGINKNLLRQKLVQAYRQTIPPRRLAADQGAPVRKVCTRGELIDLGTLPFGRYCEVETAPYLTAATIVARSGGTLNLSYHRLMRHDCRRMAIFMTPGSHLDQIFQDHRRRGRAMAVAGFIGSHPLWALGSLASGPLDLDEYAVIGGLIGGPLDVVAGHLDPELVVPARAEIAFEGYILPDFHIDEGPFGEFAGYATARRPCPVLEVELLSHREQPIFQDIVPGRTEHLTMAAASIEAYLRVLLDRDADAVTEIYLPAPLTLFLKIDRAAAAGLEVRPFLERLLRALPFVKYVYAFDPDIDLRNQRSVQWAIATRSQPAVDALLLADCKATELDPSETDGLTSKWALDATAKPSLKHFPPINRVPPDALADVDIDRMLAKPWIKPDVR
jgi:UbiD family decarboxylase